VPLMIFFPSPLVEVEGFDSPVLLRHEHMESAAVVVVDDDDDDDSAPVNGFYNIQN